MSGAPGDSCARRVNSLCRTLGAGSWRAWLPLPVITEEPGSARAPFSLGPAGTVVEAAPGSYLRLLAGQALVLPGPGDEFLVASAGLVAVVAASVMLGLVTGPEAESVREAAGKAVAASSPPGSWLSIRSGADGYWRLRSRGREDHRVAPSSASYVQGR